MLRLGATQLAIAPDKALILARRQSRLDRSGCLRIRCLPRVGALQVNGGSVSRTEGAHPEERSDEGSTEPVGEIEAEHEARVVASAGARQARTVIPFC